MSRIQPKGLEQLGELASWINEGSETMGFLTEDALIMAHCPEMLMGAGHFIEAVLSKGALDAGLKRMIGFVTSQASGCEYCSAHTSFSAMRHGIDPIKFNAIWDFANSPLFSEQERAALDLAHKAGMIPNACTDSDFDNLSLYFSKEEIVEIVFVMSLYSFLNKFNDTIKTTVEAEPLLTYKNLKQQS